MLQSDWSEIVDLFLITEALTVALAVIKSPACFSMYTYVSLADTNDPSLPLPLL